MTRHLALDPAERGQVPGYRSAGEWLYLRVYPRGSDCDEVLAAGVAWLCGNEGIRSWHFLRYLDLTGHHLRLRLRGSADAVDEWYERVPALCGKVSQTQPVETDRLIPDAMTGPVAQQPGIRLDLYSPELLKYGRAGVVAAERHFWAASVWAAEEQIWCVPISRRRGLAARYLAEALPLLAPDTPQRAFEGHTAMWSWRLPHGEARAPLRAHLEVLAEAGAGEEMSTLVKPLVDDVAATLEAWRHRDPLDLGEADGGRLWLRRGLNLLHMDVNRLGLNPPEECLAGLAARRIAMNSRTNGTTQRKGRP